MIFLITQMITKNNGTKDYIWHETHGGTYRSLKKRLRVLTSEHPLIDFRVFKLSTDGTKTLINI